MLTFESSNGILNKHGALVADDGTVLVPNGECPLRNADTLAAKT